MCGVCLKCVCVAKRDHRSMWCEFVYKMIFQKPLKKHLLATAMQRTIQIVFISATDLSHQCVQVSVCVRARVTVYDCTFACINFVLHTIEIESYILR